MMINLRFRLIRQPVQAKRLVHLPMRPLTLHCRLQLVNHNRQPARLLSSRVLLRRELLGKVILILRNPLAPDRT